jgi:uncharacterized phage infection (PIP) family protein YhgE
MFSRRTDKIIAEIRELRDVFLNSLSAMEKRIMSGVDDLNAAVASIATDLTAETTVVNQVVAALQAAGQGGGLTDAEAEALAQQLQGSATNITTLTTNLQNALPSGGSGSPSTPAPAKS